MKSRNMPAILDKWEELFIRLLAVLKRYRKAYELSLIHIQEIGTTVQDIQYKDTYLESIMYPKTDIAKLDKKIKDTVDTYQKNFLQAVKPYKEKRKAEFNICLLYTSRCV